MPLSDNAGKAIKECTMNTEELLRLDEPVHSEYMAIWVESSVRRLRILWS